LHSKLKTANVGKPNNTKPKETKKPQIKVEQNSFLKQFFYLIGVTIMLIALALIMLVSITSCTYSINQVHTSGEASDVVDETENVDPTIDPTLNIPSV